MLDDIKNPPPKRTPPQEVIDEARLAAMRSPCQKSKRGAVLFNPVTGQKTIGAWNSRPDNKCDLMCQISDAPSSRPMRDKDARDRPPSRCSTLCLHAEARALRIALAVSERSHFVADGDFAFVLVDMELVHVKVENDRVVPSGGPSCWQCAKDIADNGIRGVWLYETTHVGMMDQQEEWIFYPNDKFYKATMEACRLAL